jgi:transposase-like protein
MAKRRLYSDKFKAGALTMLLAQNYPEDVYALERVARHLHIPGRTLRRWYKGENGQPPDELVAETKKELAELFEDEIRTIMSSLPSVRDEATYRDLVTGAAILTDKLQLLRGKPTERSEQTVNVGFEHLANMSNEELWEVVCAGDGVGSSRN